MISIVIPTYNRAKLIHRALDSVLAQTYEDWECIVVDDHSTDKTKDVVEKYIQKDERFEYIVNNRTKGAQGARNTGILKAKGEWVSLFDSDNQMHPDMLMKLQASIKPLIDVVSSFSYIIEDGTNKQIDEYAWICEGNIHKNLFSRACYVDFNQAIIRKDKLFEIGLLDEECPSMQEWDTHIRLSKIAQYTTVKESLLDYYVNGSDAISSDKRREVSGHLYVFKKHIKEWKQDEKAIHRMVKTTYSLIRANTNYWFRFVSLIKLARLSSYTFRHVVGYRVRSLKKIFI